MDNTGSLQKLRDFFQTGATRPYEFRKQQLIRLKKGILEKEKQLYEALYADLKKSPEESWVTELGMVLSELKYAINNLRDWMEPERVSTNLLNLPSSSRVMREPLGVVMIIGPWNYPFQLLINPMVGAMAAGNCIVIKPSETAPATANVMRQLIEENFSAEYILYVEGDGAAVIPSMLNNFRFDHIFYTGNTAVGKSIYRQAAEKLVPVTLELGGKSPCVVENDANIKVAARRIAIAKFSNAGQMCVAPDYVLVHESKRDLLIEEIKTAVTKFFSDDPASDYSYSKIVNEKHFDRLISYLKNGRIVYGGRHDRNKLFIEPTIIDQVDIQSPLMKEELFGPVLPVISFSSDEEAQKIIAENPNPLAFYVYTSSRKKENRWLQDVPAGGVCINNSSWHLTNHHLPFGGRGNSGFGQYHGRYSFETFSHLKAILKTPTWFDPAMKYPPFKGKLKWYKWFTG